MKSLLNCRSLIKVAVIMVVVAIVAVLNVATSLSNAQGQDNPATTGGGQLPPELEIISEQLGVTPVPKTGQTTFVLQGDDGDLQSGEEWPNPRFTDNGDETVTDNLTGLIWTKHANLFGVVPWSNALTSCNNLVGDGSISGGPIDGSIAGDWHLANRFELESLQHMGFFNPVVPDTLGTGKWNNGDPFNSVQSAYYGSSTTLDDFPTYAWLVCLKGGCVVVSSKDSVNFVWCVRGGQ